MELLEEISSKEEVHYNKRGLLLSYTWKYHHDGYKVEELFKIWTKTSTNAIRKTAKIETTNDKEMR